jgi:ABC-type nitrate/sulfonate/bicarbonate transport system substrate-binding protein
VLLEKFIKQNPGTVRTFVTGVAKAIEWSRTTPRSEVVGRMVAIVDKRGRNEDTGALKNWKSFGVAETGGRIVDSEFSIWVDWLSGRGEIKTDQVKLSSLYINEFNDGAAR